MRQNAVGPIGLHITCLFRAIDSCCGVVIQLHAGKGIRVKVKVHTLDIAPLCSESPPQKRSGMARVLKVFHSFTCTL